MGMERLKLANLLMNQLDNIEQESGIFLIKPMYSYRGRSVVRLILPVRTMNQTKEIYIFFNYYVLLDFFKEGKNSHIGLVSVNKKFVTTF